jgi:hypothetical protein
MKLPNQSPREFTGIRGVTFKKTVFFIVTAMTILNPTHNRIQFYIFHLEIFIIVYNLLKINI